MLRVCADLAREDADPAEGRVKRWEKRLAPWGEIARMFRAEGFYERFPAKGQIDIEVANGSELLLVSLSDTLTYFCLAQQANSPVTDKGEGANFSDVDTVTECTGGW